MTEDKRNILITRFMGYIYETEVTVYNYGMDYHSSYDKETIYSNIEPKLKKHNEKFFTKVVAVHTNYFDSDEQDNEFKYKSFLSYKNWNELMPIIKKIHSCVSDYDTFNDRKLELIMMNIKRWLMDADLERTFLAVTEFVVWFNKNK